MENQWYSKQNCSNVKFQEYWISIIYSISLFGTFMTTRILLSRFFGFTFFKAKLSDIEKLLPFNIINGVAILVNLIYKHKDFVCSRLCFCCIHSI